MEILCTYKEDSRTIEKNENRTDTAIKMLQKNLVIIIIC